MKEIHGRIRSMLGKILIAISGVLLLTTVGLVIVQKASPQELPTSPGNAPISWASNQFDIVMFPGTSTTTKVSFRSSQSLTNVGVNLTPSLVDIASVTPKIFYNIQPNQDYVVTLTLKAPPEFTKRSFGGTLQLTNGQNVISQPLRVGMKTDWKDQNINGVIVDYPINWSATNIAKSYAVIIANNPNPGQLSDDSLQKNSFFEIDRLSSSSGKIDNSPANPNRLPLDQWFSSYFSGGFSVPISSKNIITLNGIVSLRIEIDEVGGRRVHVYIPKDDQIYEISYGLFVNDFVTTYESMERSVKF